MGTQFTSRLKESDRRRIYKGIVDALMDQLPSPVAPARKEQRQRAGKAPSVAKAVKSLSSVQRRRFGDAAVREVLNVAADHGFFTTFEESELFVDVLSWLQRLRSDAEFNAFEGIIEEYGLGHSVSPVKDLARKLEDLTNKARMDLFRVASTTAGKAILAETALHKVPPKIAEAPAPTFGRQLSTLSLRDLVTNYVHRFVYEVLANSMSKSDPTSSATIVREAIGEIRKSTERIAKRGVERIVKEGKLSDPRRIHQIVIEALTEYRRPEAA